MELSIECQKRVEGEKPKALRREGVLPAVLYGHDGTSSVDLKVNTRQAQALLRKAVVNKSVITVDVPEMPWNGKVILREVQTHPWKNEIYHLSFFSIADQAELEVTMPIHYSGEAKGVKNDGGMLDTVMNELQLKCAPDKIPQVLDINVSDLGVGDSLHLGQIVLPEGVTAVGDASQMVVSVLAPRKADSGDAEEGATETEAAG
ncbi:MAG: 50S ribosomal protein L25/general stress protein Ctc [Cyanobacteria bacterium P01_A01_bin.105]